MDGIENFPERSEWIKDNGFEGLQVIEGRGVFWLLLRSQVEQEKVVGGDVRVRKEGSYLYVDGEMSPRRSCHS